MQQAYTKRIVACRLVQSVNKLTHYHHVSSDELANYLVKLDMKVLSLQDI
jgi:hypothetical protein